MIKHLATDIISFLLIYDREVVLPIDEPKLLMIHEYMISIIKEISHIKKEVKFIIQKAQDHIM